MKIVHISHLYHPSQGGVQFFFKNISERLVKDYGDDVTMVTTNSYFGPERKLFKKIDPEEEFVNGVRVIRFPYRRWHIYLYSFLFKVMAKLSVKKPEWMVLEANGPYSLPMKRFLMNIEADAFCGSSSNYYYMQLPLWRRCNFFYYGSIHLNEDPNKTTLYPTQVASMNASTLYLANTAYEKERLERLGVQKGKVFVLGTGVDMKPFCGVSSGDVQAFRQEQSIPCHKIVVGYVGRIERSKNVLVVIKAFAALATKNPDLYLLIAGSASDYVGELKAFCQQLGHTINSRIKWELNFSLEKKPVIFNAIDMLVLPSHNESFGLVFLEAWSCKKPVIGASIGAVRDVINEGVDGLLMDIDNEHSLSEKLDQLIFDDVLRTTMGENGFAKVEENYTWDIIVARLRKCYVDAGNPKINN
jgi:glycosyltransferase involved in cell wall biosynthesis